MLLLAMQGVTCTLRLTHSDLAILPVHHANEVINQVWCLDVSALSVSPGATTGGWHLLYGE